jgi:YesN/AraC family two-component response regulator
MIEVVLMNKKDINEASDLFMVEYRKRTDIFNMPANHYHDRYEIYYMLSGERYYFIKDRTYHVVKGDLVIINKNEIHKTTHVDSSNTMHERILIEFKKEFLGSIIDDINDTDLFSCFHQNINVLRLNINEQSFIENLLFKMVSENKRQSEGFKTYLKVSLVELLLFITRCVAKVSTNHFEYPNAVHKKISDIVKHINNHYMENLTLTSISKKFFISPYYFSRTFKEVTGFTFVEYVNSVRIKEAQRLLRESKLNVTQIAEKVGYENITHFGRVFKAITGFSPLKYKKNNKELS